MIAVPGVVPNGRAPGLHPMADIHSAEKKPEILVVEDDDLQYEIYEDALDGFRLTRVATASEALRAIARRQPHLIILDHILAKGELGLEFLPAFKELVPHVPVVVVSGALEVQQQMEALQGPRRAHYCIAKPVDVDDLAETVKTALSECGETEVVRQFEALERSKRVDAEALLSRSTDRLSRQSELRRRLANASGRPNVSALAREFRVARRTIIRDVRELIRRDELPAEVFPKWETDDNDSDGDEGA